MTMFEAFPLRLNKVLFLFFSLDKRDFNSENLTFKKFTEKKSCYTV